MIQGFKCPFLVEIKKITKKTMNLIYKDNIKYFYIQNLR